MDTTDKVLEEEIKADYIFKIPLSYEYNDDIDSDGNTEKIEKITDLVADMLSSKCRQEIQVGPCRKPKTGFGGAH